MARGKISFHIPLSLYLSARFFFFFKKLAMMFLGQHGENPCTVISIKCLELIFSIVFYIFFFKFHFLCFSNWFSFCNKTFLVLKITKKEKFKLKLSHQNWSLKLIQLLIDTPGWARHSHKSYSKINIHHRLSVYFFVFVS